ncbi:Phage portal protein [compost metagenome]
MGIFSRQLTNVKNLTTAFSYTDFLDALGIQVSSIDKYKLGEITYFTCLKLLAESVGKLPLELWQDTDNSSRLASEHYLNQILKRPNKYMTPFTFWSTVEMNRHHYGNAFVYIETNRGKVTGLHILPSNSVQIWVDNIGLLDKDNAIWYIYTDRSGHQYNLSYDSVMHFKTSTSFDGITGLSVLECLAINIENQKSGAAFVNTYFKNGLFAKGLLQYVGDIDLATRKKMQEQFASMASGIKNAGSILPVPLGFSFQPLNISMVDSQFLELNKYNALQIAAAFGIKPSQINDYSSSTYASTETQNRAFYVDTLMSALVQYEAESTYKLLTSQDQIARYNLEFDYDVILRADFKTRMEGYAQGINNGVITPNEARKKEGYAPDPNGNQLFINSAYVPLKDVDKQVSEKEVKN